MTTSGSVNEPATGPGPGAQPTFSSGPAAQLPTDARPVVDDDPTGIRQLLAALPDPGPMPPALVARINLSLAAELQRASTTTARPSPVGTSATVIPIRRKTPWLRPVLAVAGIAAAFVAVGVVGADLLRSGGASGASSAAMASAGSAGQGPLHDSAHSSASQERAEVTIYLDSASYTAGGLAAGAAKLVTRRGSPLRSAAAEAPAIGPIGTPVGAADCLASLDVPTADQAVLDIAMYDGQPAVVIVTTDPGGAHTAYVVKRSCSTGRPDQIRPPLHLS